MVRYFNSSSGKEKRGPNPGGSTDGHVSGMDGDQVAVEMTVEQGGKVMASEKTINAVQE